MSINSSNNYSSIIFTNLSVEPYDYEVHYYYVYVHPFATLLAAAVNFMCGLVFFHKELLNSGPFFQYSFLNSFGASTGIITIN